MLCLQKQSDRIFYLNIYSKYKIKGEKIGGGIVQD